MSQNRRGQRPAQSKSARGRASVAMGFVTGMLSGLLANGADPSRLLLDAGINPNDLSDPNARVPIGSYAALYNLVVKELDDEGFGLFSVPLKIGTFEFL